jgi:hypothetical protein
MPVATYHWCDEQLVLGAPNGRWHRRIAEITGLVMSEGRGTAPVEIEVRDDLTVRVYADEAGFETASDLLIWLTITMSDVLMRKSGSFLLHAASLVVDGRATLVFGRPHSGKSTLIWNAIEAGQEVLGDDLARFDPGTGGICAIPRPPKKRTAEAEDRPVASVEAALTEGSDLFGNLSGEPSRLVPRSRRGIVNDWRRSYPVGGLLLLRRHDGAGVSMQTLEADDKLEMLLMHARDWGAGPLAAIEALLPREGSIVHVGHGEQRRALAAALSYRSAG